MDLDRAVSSLAGGAWELYRDERGISVVELEIHQADSSMYQRAHLLAEVRARMKATLAGTLKPHRDLKYLTLRPLFELRWDIEKRAWRLYFAWRGTLKLGLRFAEKPKRLDANAVQNTHILDAWTRYMSWQRRQNG